MTNHEKFLDAMNGVDEKFLSVHIRQKCPTAGDKVKRYALAVAAYAAAIIAVAVILPFVIRHGDDPTPQPGDDPVVTETYATEPGSTEMTENAIETIVITETDEITVAPPETTETTPEVTTAPPTETTTTTAPPPPETTTTTPPPETEPPAETIPAVTVMPPIENVDPFVPTDPRSLNTSDTAPVDTETTTDWYFVLDLYRKQFNNCKTNTYNRCAYLIGWDKDYHLDYAGETVDDESMYYTEDDVIEFTVLFINMNSETVVFRDDEYSRDPLSNVVYDFVYKSYSNTDKTPGKTEVHLDPGEMWVYTASIDLAKIEDGIIQWNQAWKVTSYIEYYIGDVKYTDSLTAYIGNNYRR
ncbi:MAG: hypothetical protein IJ386_02055 [Clostridia bacterium]|nr:hypothetical protein [Clostridia bacterium]